MPAPEHLVILDTDRLQREMKRHRLGPYDLALAARTTGTRLYGILHGDNHAQLHLALVYRLAVVLGLHIKELFLAAAGDAEPSEPSTVAEITDARVLGSLLLGAGRPIKPSALADALDWPRPRVTRAGVVLALHLQAVGGVLHRSAYGYQILADEHAAPPRARDAAQRAQRRTRDIDAFAARLLLDIQTGTPTETLAPRGNGRTRHLLGGNETMALRRLLAAGYIEHADDSGFRLSDRVAFGLGFTNHPPPVKKGARREP